MKTELNLNENYDINIGIFLETNQKKTMRSHLQKLTELVPRNAKISLKMEMPLSEVESQISLTSLGRKFHASAKDRDPLAAFFTAKADIVKQIAEIDT